MFSFFLSWRWQVHLIGWGSKFDEWLPTSSPRLAKLFTRSHGCRGILVVDNVMFDQELTAVDDSLDAADAVAIVRQLPRRSSILIGFINYYMSEKGLNVANRLLHRLHNLESPVVPDVRCPPPVLCYLLTRCIVLMCSCLFV